MKIAAEIPPQAGSRGDGLLGYSYETFLYKDNINSELFALG